MWCVNECGGKARAERGYNEELKRRIDGRCRPGDGYDTPQFARDGRSAYAKVASFDHAYKAARRRLKAEAEQ